VEKPEPPKAFAPKPEIVTVIPKVVVEAGKSVAEVTAPAYFGFRKTKYFQTMVL